MLYAATPEDIAMRRKAFIHQWRLKHRAVADSLEEARQSIVHICTIAAKPMAQRAHHQGDRTAALPSAETAAVLFWVLLASGQINMRKVDGRQTLAAITIGSQLTSPSEPITSCRWILRCVRPVCATVVAGPDEVRGSKP